MSASTWAVASGYVSAGLLCLGVALTRPAADLDRPEALWAACAMALALLAVLTVWRLDLVLGDWMRQALRVSGWYPLRRPLQAVVLLVSVWLAWALLREALPAATSWPVVGCVLATVLLAFVAWGRLLSWHALDSVLNFRWQRMSIGRWMELLGLLAVVASAVSQGRAAVAAR